MIFHPGTRYLRNIKTEAVYIHSDKLAAQPHMVPFTPPLDTFAPPPTQAIPVTATTSTASDGFGDLKPLSELTKAEFNKLKSPLILAYLQALGQEPETNYMKNKAKLRPWFLTAIGE